MPMFDMKNITIQNLQELIDNKVFENKELEYKDYSFTDGKMLNTHKDKFMKEIAAFANTHGGTIIIGMQENEERLPINLSGAGLSIGEYDNWLSSFRQLVLSRIRPHLHGIECTPIQLEDENIVIVINVPKSYARPHSFWDGNKDEFYMRYSNGITYMDINDLRKEFLLLEGLQNKIRQFHKDRISMILANECIGDLGSDAKFVLHVIPEWSFELGNMIDLNKIEKDNTLELFSKYSRGYRYNADGYCAYAINSEYNLLGSYTQIFHNGIVEVVEIRLVSQYNNKNKIYRWDKFEKIIVEALEKYKKILETQNVPKPWHIMATLLNAKGYTTTYNDWGEDSETIDRDIVYSLDGVLHDDIELEVALTPVLDSLANAFGFRGRRK